MEFGLPEVKKQVGERISPFAGDYSTYRIIAEIFT
jgi:hypothetical protein